MAGPACLRVHWQVGHHKGQELGPHGGRGGLPHATQHRLLQVQAQVLAPAALQVLLLAHQVRLKAVDEGGDLRGGGEGCTTVYKLGCQAGRRAEAIAFHRGQSLQQAGMRGQGAAGQGRAAEAHAAPRPAGRPAPRRRRRQRGPPPAPPTGRPSAPWPPRRARARRAAARTGRARTSQTPCKAREGGTAGRACSTLALEMHPPWAGAPHLQPPGSGRPGAACCSRQGPMGAQQGVPQAHIGRAVRGPGARAWPRLPVAPHLKMTLSSWCACQACASR